MGRGVEELTDWSLPELLDAARALTGELAGRLADPMLADRLPHFPATDRLHPDDEWGLYSDVVEDISFEEASAQTPVEVLPPRGTFPELHTSVEELGRVVDSARTALAGHTARLFDEHASRKEILGIPEGKSAYRNAVEYLREHLRISRRQAKARIERSRHVLATPTLDRTQTVPPRLPVLSRATSEADLDPGAVDVIAATLVEARAESADAQVAPADVEKLLGEGEQSLVSSARILDPDALGKVCAHWRVRFDALVNPDGAEPTDNQRRVAQGLFYRGRRTGLHRWSLVATDDQHEVLKTIVSATSDLRAQDSTPPAADVSGPAGTTDPAGPVDTAGSADHTAESAADTRQAEAPETSGNTSTAHPSTAESCPIYRPAGSTESTETEGSGAAEATEPPEGINVQDATDVTTKTAPPAEGTDASTDATGAAETTGIADIKEAPEATGSGEGSEGVRDVDVDVEAELEGDRETGGFRDVDGIEGAGAFSDPGILWAQQVRAAEEAEARTAAERAAVFAAAMAGEAVGWNVQASNPDDLDERTRNQQELDGVISALTGALALTSGDAAPDGGRGARPQVLVTIDYQTLLDHAFRPSSELPARRSARFDPELCPEPCCDSSLEVKPWVDEGPASADDPQMDDVPATEEDSAPGQDPAPGQPLSKGIPGGAPPDSGPGDRGIRYSSASYAGEISPTTIRAWACDAELIPVVLGGDGEVLDLGRSQRLFTRKLRRAITARDGGCTAPGCTIPAPWCEAHHVEHWEHGGPSSVDNGVLLCSHHHHAVHAGAWTISMRNGVPWFIPAAYRDPYQRPRRNTYWRPDAAA